MCVLFFPCSLKIINDAVSDALSIECWDRVTREIFGLTCHVKTGKATCWESPINVFLYWYLLPVVQLVSDSSAFCTPAQAWERLDVKEPLPVSGPLFLRSLPLCFILFLLWLKDVIPSVWLWGFFWLKMLGHQFQYIGNGKLSHPIYIIDIYEG